MANAARTLPRTERGLQAYLSNIRAPAERGWLALGDGLTVCLEPSGAKTFQARIRRQGESNARRVRIGSFPALSVADARKKLADMKSLAREGRDPALEQRRARAGIKPVRTLADLVDEYLGRREGVVAAKTFRLESDLLEGVLAPKLGARLLLDLAPVDFGSVVSDYAARLKREGRSSGTNANKLLAVARRMFRTARGWGLVDTADPTAGLARPAKEAPQNRVLWDGRVLVGPDASVNELGQLVAALRADPSPVQASDSTRVALLLTTMLGLRALEACSLEWRALDLQPQAPALTVTTSKTRAGLRTLPLPTAAAELLRGLKPRGAGRFVFPARDGARRADHLHPESLSRAFARACERLSIKGASLHDLRRTCLSGLIELGHEAVAERIAGHTARHVLGRHYDRSTRLEPMRAALEAWAAAVERARIAASEE
ncbi:MAG TPA: integrase arm-type DNA-binding domain-containing protein [Methylovirgula sp.]|nr:integrase arm-type DNA-binding domain-containing protein [Methylovirgula sp.]